MKIEVYFAVEINYLLLAYSQKSNYRYDSVERSSEGFIVYGCMVTIWALNSKKFDLILRIKSKHSINETNHKISIVRVDSFHNIFDIFITEYSSNYY
jgi:hypothetical protein